MEKEKNVAVVLDRVVDASANVFEAAARITGEGIEKYGPSAVDGVVNKINGK